MGIGGGTGSTQNLLHLNNSSSPANITRNESNTSGGNLLQLNGNADLTTQNNINKELNDGV